MAATVLQNWLPFAITLLAFIGVLYLANRLLFRRDMNSEHKFPRQMLMVILVLCALVACIIALPLSEGMTTQVLSLLGIVLSGLLAFSSTTIFGNLVAGVMMRFTQPFRTGDFIRVNDYFGRVAERGLLDCEIQTASRELIAIPNSMLVNNAVAVVRSSGTIISAEVSLGYDVHHDEIEKLLLQAAQNTGLEDPFVHVTALGDFSVNYKLSGLLVDVKSLLTMRSTLYRQVLDCLHHGGIEIMSPNFVNQYRLADDYRAIPRAKVKQQPTAEAEPETAAEDIAFDKAEQAEQKEKQQSELQDEIKAQEALLSEAEKEQKEQIKARIEVLKNQLDELKNEQVDEQ